MRLRTLAFLVAALAPAAALACKGHKETTAQETPAAASAFAFVSLDELGRWVDAKGATVIDANRAERYQKGHIPGAVHLTADTITADKLPADKSAKLVFYCANEQCLASHQAAKVALGLGYTQVFVYAGGIAGWEKAGKPVETAPAKAAAPAKADDGRG